MRSCCWTRVNAETGLTPSSRVKTWPHFDFAIHALRISFARAVIGRLLAVFSLAISYLQVPELPPFISVIGQVGINFEQIDHLAFTAMPARATTERRRMRRGNGRCVF